MSGQIKKLTEDGFEKLIKIAAKTGCNYFCFNIKVTICNNCNHISKTTEQSYFS